MDTFQTKRGVSSQGRIFSGLIHVALGILQAYVLDLSRRWVSSMVLRGFDRFAPATHNENETNTDTMMNAKISREEVSRGLADMGHSSRMAALKIRHAVRAAMRDLQKSTGDHAHELQTVTKGSFSGVGRYVRRRPVRALLISLGVGVCLGAWVRR